MVGFEITVQVEKNRRYEFLQAWKLLTMSEDANPACLEQRLYEDVHEGNTFLWVECWNSAQQLAVHLNSDRFRTVLGAIEVLGECNALRHAQWKLQE